MTFGLEKKYIDFIKKILCKNIPDKNAKFYIFGSRAKGDFKEYSDIDIAINLKDKKLSTDLLGKITTEFIDSTLPYEVDVVDLNSIDEKFKKLIEKDLIEINFND